MKKRVLRTLSVMMVAILVGLSINYTAFADGEDKILELNMDSEYYYSMLDDTSCNLPTYKHADFGDYPFVKLNDLVNALNAQYAGKKTFGLLKSGNEYIITCDGRRIIYFDTESNTMSTDENIKYVDSDLENGHVNNGIAYDVLYLNSTSKFLATSEKTNYIIGPTLHTVDLNKYNVPIVEKNSELYVPYGLIQNVLTQSSLMPATYNGRDYFYLLSSVSTGNTAVYSSEGKFKIQMLFDEEGERSQMVQFEPEYTTTLVTGEYCFKSEALPEILDPDTKDIYAYIVLEDDGSGDSGTGYVVYYRNDEELEIYSSVDMKFEWYEGLDNKIYINWNYYDLLTDELLLFTPGGSSFINKDETWYMAGNRNADMAVLNYNLLDLYFGEYYPDKTCQVCDFKKMCADLGIEEGMLSTDANAYDRALAKMCVVGLDNGHTNIATTSIFTGSSSDKMNEYWDEYSLESVKLKGLMEKQRYYKALRKAYRVEEGLDIVGSTAVITFDNFNSEITRDAPAPVSSTYFTDTELQGDTCNFVALCMNEILSHPEVNNVVFDVTNNGGGVGTAVAYIEALMTSDPISVNGNLFDNSVTEFHYKVDLNQDGIFGGEGDTFQGKYNFYVMTSEASFSSANALPTVVKNTGVGKIIGKQSGGGCAPVSMLYADSAQMMNTNGFNPYMLKTDNGYIASEGVPVDYELDSDIWYNHKELDKYLEGINPNKKDDNSHEKNKNKVPKVPKTCDLFQKLSINYII